MNIDEICSKYHFIKQKICYKSNDKIIYFVKHKSKISNLFFVDCSKIYHYNNHDVFIKECDCIIPINIKKKTFHKEQEKYLEYKINLGSPKIILNLINNTFKFIIPMIYDRYCKFEKINNYEYLDSFYDDLGLKYGYYLVESKEIS